MDVNIKEEKKIRDITNSIQFIVSDIPYSEFMVYIYLDGKNSGDPRIHFGHTSMDSVSRLLYIFCDSYERYLHDCAISPIFSMIGGYMVRRPSIDKVKEEINYLKNKIEEWIKSDEFKSFLIISQ